MKPVYIVGHKNPDTDSICAALAYAKLKEVLGMNVVACRAGEVNRETGFVLEYFGVQSPVLLPDLHCRVRDLLNGDKLVINPDIPVWEAWMTMRSRGIKTLPVVDKFNHLMGLVTAGDLAEKYLTDLGERNLVNLQVSVANIVKTLGGSLTNGSLETELKGKVVVWSGDQKEQGIPGCIALIGDESDEQEAAVHSDAACLILTGGAQLSSSLTEKIRLRGIVVIEVPMDIFTAAKMMLISIPVRNIMLTDNLMVFNEDDLLEDVKKMMLETRFRNYPVVDEQNRVLGVISRYHLLGFSRKQVILVDHNELSQAVEGMEEAQIVEVVDHHRVGGVQTGEPILFRNEPLGATCTLIAKAWFEHGRPIPRQIAGLLCSGILSDTMVFKSPTCTTADREIAERLSKIAGLDLMEFGVQMLKKGSGIIGLSSGQILNMDFKKFDVGKAKIGIGQVNAMGFDEVAAMKSDLLAEMENTRRETGMDYVLLMVTDLISEATELYIVGNDPEKIGEAFKGDVINNALHLPGVLSRKKQVVPPLTKYFS